MVWMYWMDVEWSRCPASQCPGAPATISRRPRGGYKYYGSCCIWRLSILHFISTLIIIHSTNHFWPQMLADIIGCGFRIKDPNSDNMSWIRPKFVSMCDIKIENLYFYSLAKESPSCITKGRAQNGLELLILIPALYWMALWLGFMHPRAAYSNLSSFGTDHIWRGIYNFAQNLCQLSSRLEVSKRIQSKCVSIVSFPLVAKCVL